MDEAQINKLVELLAGKLTDKLQEQQKEQMNKMQQELDKIKETLNKRLEDAASEVEKDVESEVGGDKTPKGYARVQYDYASSSKIPNAHLPIVNPGKPPSFDGIRYTDWAHRMKLHLIAAICWEVVDVGVRMPEEGSEMTSEDYMDIQLNATAATLILQCLTPEDNNKVNGMENAKLIWDTLKVSFEGDVSVRKGNIELLQSKIENFGLSEGETTQAMFDRFMTLVNRIRALGDKHWDDNSAPRKLCRVYRQKNNMLASVIMQRDNYDTMTPHEMLAKLKHHEVLEDEAKEAMGQKKSVALKASQDCGSSHCNKRHDHEDSSENEHDGDLDEEQVLLVRNFKRFLMKKKGKMRNCNGNKPYKKRFCYGCGDVGHFIAECPKEKKKQWNNNENDKRYKGKKRGEAHLGEEWDSNDESDDDNDQGKKKSVATIAIQETSSTTITNHASST